MIVLLKLVILQGTVASSDSILLYIKGPLCFHRRFGYTELL